MNQNDTLSRRIRAARRAMFRLEDRGDIEGGCAVRDLIRSAESQRRTICYLREVRR